MEPWTPINTWNPKQLETNGCSNMAIEILYIGNGCLGKHPFLSGCLGFQADKIDQEGNKGTGISIEFKELWGDDCGFEEEYQVPSEKLCLCKKQLTLVEN